MFFVTGGPSATLTAAVGLSRAKALALLGEVFTAQQARDWGMIWSVLGDAALAEAAMQNARTLVALDSPVAAHFKCVFSLYGMGQFEQAIQEECATQRQLAG